MSSVESESENKVDHETAENEFDRFVDEMDLELDISKMNADTEDDFIKAKDRLIKSICRGDLIVNDEGEMTYTPKNAKSNYDKPIHFNQTAGQSRLASDRRKETHYMSKMYTMMGEMCKVNPNVFKKLVGIDIKICESIFKLLTV